jgi:hypothetical protein
MVGLGRIAAVTFLAMVGSVRASASLPPHIQALIDQHWIGEGEVEEFEAEMMLDATVAPTEMPTDIPTEFGDTDAPTTAPSPDPLKHGYSLPYSMPAVVDDPSLWHPQNDAYPATPFPTASPNVAPEDTMHNFDRAGIEVGRNFEVKDLVPSKEFKELVRPVSIVQNEEDEDQVAEEASSAWKTSASLLLMEDGAAVAAAAYKSPAVLPYAGGSYIGVSEDGLHGDDLLGKLVAAGVIEEGDQNVFDRDFVTDGPQAHTHDDDDLFGNTATSTADDDVRDDDVFSLFTDTAYLNAGSAEAIEDTSSDDTAMNDEVQSIFDGPYDMSVATPAPTSLAPTPVPALVMQQTLFQVSGLLV